MEISKLVEEAGKLQEAQAYCFPELTNEIAAIELKFQFQNNVAFELVVKASAIMQLTFNEL